MRASLRGLPVSPEWVCSHHFVDPFRGRDARRLTAKNPSHNERGGRDQKTRPDAIDKQADP
jgi:hypothetical protein